MNYGQAQTGLAIVGDVGPATVVQATPVESTQKSQVSTADEHKSAQAA